MDGRPHRIVAVGEVLFDCFPDGERLGGAPLNFAYHLHRLGQPVALCSRVGDDERGRRIRAALEQAGMATEGLQVDPDHPTGWVSVALDGAGGHSFTIHCDVAYDHLEAAAVARLAGAPGVALYYFGTLACRTPRGRAAVLGGAAACRGRRLLDVNLRPGCWDRGQVVACLEAATVAKLNHEEVATLAPLLGLPEAEGAAAEGLRRRFDLEAVVVTRGAAGAAWYHGAGRAEAAAPPVAVADTVGAGDAFAAVAALGLLAGWPPETTLERAVELAAAVCTVRGACPEGEVFHRPFRERWGLEAAG